MASSTRALFCGSTNLPRTTLDTVITETPAARATSVRVVRWDFRLDMRITRSVDLRRGEGAVDRQLRAAYECGLARCEEQHAVCNVFRRAQAPERLSLEDFAACRLRIRLLGEHALHDRRINVSRADAVNANPERRAVFGKTACQHDDRSLGAAVCGRRYATDLAHDRGDIHDDAGVLLREYGPYRLRQHVDTFEVGVEHPVPVRKLKIPDPFVHVDAGVVHQHINSAERLANRCDTARDLRGARYIHDRWVTPLVLRIQALGGSLQACRIDVKAVDVGAFAAKAFSNAAADAVRCACYDHDLSVETLHRLILPCARLPQRVGRWTCANNDMIHRANTKKPADQSGTLWYHLPPKPSRRIPALCQMVRESGPGSAALLGNSRLPAMHRPTEPVQTMPA